MFDRKSIVIDPIPGTGWRIQAANISGGTKTDKITSDPPRDAEEMNKDKLPIKGNAKHNLTSPPILCRES